MNTTTRLLALASLLLLLGAAACGEPDTDQWSRKDAHGLCGAAIDAYPTAPAPPCHAMHMCINEAQLTMPQQLKLLEMIRKTKGCPEP